MLRVVLVFWLMIPAAASAQVEALAVPGHSDAALVVPASVEPRPVIVALHGNYDRPEWACESWAEIVEGRAFVLCPRGAPRRDVPRAEDRWTYRGADAVVREVEAARRALVARYGARVAGGPDVWVGFSLGAHLVAELASRADGPRRIQLVEGGRTLFRHAGARRRFARAGGRVAIVCGQRSCDAAARAASEAIVAAGGDARVRFVEVGHQRHPLMTPLLRETLDWLVAGDPRFAR
jgi:predicted esterase